MTLTTSHKEESPLELPEKKTFVATDDPLWYKDAVIYELHVRAFFDSDGDGIGDFRGLSQKLDYLQDLGVTALWLLPFYPSPLKDDGYDISNFQDIHEAYGKISEFKIFLKEAHRRGLRVITELVLNHTSDRHPWFQRARRAPAGSRYRNFYVWNDTPAKYKSTRIIFKDFESTNWTWDAVAGAYYWHRFYAHQPDLNFESADVQKAVRQVLDFWMALGVDGVRLDAIPYLFEREGTDCENLPETHDFLKKLRAHLDKRFPCRMFLAEANQWPEDASAYFGNGDECHMAFHFPIMPRLFMALKMEDRFPIIDILKQTPDIAESCQWALFLRNHDELTLEMVTDEERDYMYRSYAKDAQMRINLGIRRRLAPLLGNNRRKIELMTGLLFSLPGTPVIYYGDEIGMGDNVYLGDRNGVRTPMQWSSDRNAGFSKANPQKLYLPIVVDPEYHYEALNVEALESNPHSLLWWTKRLLALRKRYRAFGRGSIEFLHPGNPKIFAFIRRCEEETILVVANLSRFCQFVELDLSPFQNWAPIELFGRTKFPSIGELPYLLTLSPHAFYWFLLKPEKDAAQGGPAGEERLRCIDVDDGWDEIFNKRKKEETELLLGAHLPKCRWFGGKAHTVQRVEIKETVPMAPRTPRAYVVICEVFYTDADSETYSVPIAYAPDAAAEGKVPFARVRIRNRSEEGVLYDAFADHGFLGDLLDGIQRRKSFKGGAGEIQGVSARIFKQIRGADGAPVEPRPLGVEQSNTSVLYGDRLILKWYRRLESGIQPDLEISRFLTEGSRYAHTPPLGGFLEYKAGKNQPVTLATLQGYVKNEGDAWRYMLDALGRYLEDTLARQAELKVEPVSCAVKKLLENAEMPETARQLIGMELQSAHRLGERTAELHAALASSADDAQFAPEPFTPFYQRSLYQSFRNITGRSFKLLGAHMQKLDGEVKTLAGKVLGLEQTLAMRFQSVVDVNLRSKLIRCHGDYHLGQVLFTGNDFVIFDFEGEPARSIAARRLKTSPFRDVAGMLRSFQYAVYAEIFEQQARGMVTGENLPLLETLGQFWQRWISQAFLSAYLAGTASSSFLSADKDEVEILLSVFLLEKAVYELAYELNNRPAWVKVPLAGLLQLLEEEGTGHGHSNE